MNFRRPFWLLALPVAGGCYTYTPLQSPQPGMEVRARLTAEAAARRSQGLDDPVVRYDGVIVGADADSIALDVLVARSSTAFQEITIRDTVTIPRAELQALMQRRISAGKTALFTAGAAVAAVAIVAGFEQIVGGGGDENGNGGPPAFRQPTWLGLSINRLLSWLAAHD